MRVLELTDADVFAGTERHMLDLAAELRRQGIEASVGCPAPSPLAERCRAAGVPVLPVTRGPTWDRALVAALHAELSSGRIDLIHSHNGRSALNAALARRRAGRGACVSTQHFILPGRAARRGARALAARLVHRFVERQTARHVAISASVREEMIRRADASPDRIDVVLNGLPDPGPPDPARRAALRAALGAAEEQVLLVCVARLQAEKNIETLVDAMADVAPRAPSVRCVVCGDGSLRAALQSRIDRSAAGSAVRLLGFRDDALDVIAAGDLFVLPSALEGFGLVLLEAMAVSRPVIASNAGGPREIVEHGRTGLLVAPGDAASLAGAIVELARDAPRRVAHGAAGRARYLAMFTADRMAREMAEVYRKAVTP